MHKMSDRRENARFRGSHRVPSQQSVALPPVDAAGTPLQQLWQIANFHEKRLNRVERAHIATSADVARTLQSVTAGEGAGRSGSVMAELRSLAERVAALETKGKGRTKSKKNTVSLEVSEG